MVLQVSATGIEAGASANPAIWVRDQTRRRGGRGKTARRRVAKQELAKAGVGVAAAPPKTLAMLLEEFFSQHVDKKLAPKTAERYRQQAQILDPELLAMPLADITPLHLNREWNRLLQSGGRKRQDKTPRALSAKTVRSTSGRRIQRVLCEPSSGDWSPSTPWRTASRRYQGNVWARRCCQPSSYS